jgi:hypothetical protein
VLKASSPDEACNHFCDFELNVSVVCSIPVI